MVGRTGIRRDNERNLLRATRNRKMENHDRPRLKVTWHIEEEKVRSIILIFALLIERLASLS